MPKWLYIHKVMTFSSIANMAWYGFLFRKSHLL